MTGLARVAVSGISKASLDDVVNQIAAAAREGGAKIRGSLVLPPTDAAVPISDTPDSPVRVCFARIHTVILDIDPIEGFLRGLMRIQVPDGVNIEIIMRS